MKHRNNGRDSSKKHKKKGRFLQAVKVTLVALLGFVFVLMAGLTGVNVYVRKDAKNYILSLSEAQSLQNVDCILVLGASVRNGDTPSPMLSDRLDKGIELYELGCSPKLIMSGDHGSIYYDEVNVMKNYAKERNVPSEDIFMDHAGFSTYESMYRAREVFGAERIIIVTQSYHLYRAVYIARQLGLDAYGVAADEKSYSGQTARNIREYLATAKDVVKCIFKPKPTVLGSYTDLKGSGDVTNDGN